MKPTYRRAIGMTATLVVMVIYSFFAVSVGSLFGEKPIWIEMSYFSIAGMAWVIPLYPVYKWMRGLSAEEEAAEKPPQAAALKKK